MSQSNVILEMHGISKFFPGSHALDGVDLDVLGGEVHVLLGANGAGKSTLIKILTGVYPPDAGQILLKGQAVTFKNPNEAQRAGISVIYQELSLIRHLTVTENIFLGNEPQRIPGLPIIDRDRMATRAQELLDRLNLVIDPHARIEELTPAEQRMVEVARALHFSAELIIMDEPTAALSAREVSDLFSVIRALRAQGVAIIYVSHRLEEIMQIGDRATVLCDGRKVATVNLTETPLDELIQMMVGRHIAEEFPKNVFQTGPEILRVEGLTRHGRIEDISFSLHQGEILGVAGLVGAGGTALARAIFGADSPDHGTIYIENQKVQIDSPEAAIAQGIGFLTENRQEQGLVLDMIARDNMTLAALENAWSGPFIDHSAESDMGVRYAERLGIRMEALLQRTLFLSGGTQQKLVLAKWLATHSRVLIFDEPTKAIDVGARVEIYRLMDELVQQGTGIIIISTNLSEILGMCDRIIVLRNGQMAAILPRADASRQTILAYASGGGVL